MQDQQLSNHEVSVGGYSFSYISKNEFESIFKHVKRERRKKHDEKLWEQFLMKKQEKQAANPPQEKILEASHPRKENPSNEITDIENCKCIKPSAPVTQHGATKTTQDHSSVRHSHQRNQEIRQVAEQPQTNQDCQDCAFHNLGCHESANDRPNAKPTACDTNLYETTNFDEEFKRVEELRDKIAFALKSIETALHQEGYKILDQDDLLRNRMRTSEFAARFKRNYHYQITRQVNEIKKLNSNESWKKTNIPVAVKKFKSSHQVAVQGLQAVEKHLRTTCDNSPHPWLQDFLSSICEMENLFSSVFECDTDEDHMVLDTAGFVPTIQNYIIYYPTLAGYAHGHTQNQATEAVLFLWLAFRTLCSGIAVQLDSITSKHKKEPEVKRKKKKHTVKRNDARDNLWMYRTHKDWKTKASELARVKLARINKKKLEAELGLDEKPLPLPVQEHLPDLKMEVKQREGASLRKHVRSMKEDQVRTMMEIVPDATDSDREDEKPEAEDCQNPGSSTTNQDQQPEQGGKTRPDKSSKEVPARPPNVGYICLSRPEEDSPMKISAKRSETTGSHLSKHNAQMAAQYRKALQSYQRKMKWYNPKVISSIERMTDQIYEEYLSTVASEINIDHIISNLIDLEMRS